MVLGGWMCTHKILLCNKLVIVRQYKIFKQFLNNPELYLIIKLKSEFVNIEWLGRPTQVKEESKEFIGKKKNKKKTNEPLA